MAKEICISTTPHETRLAILEDDQLAEIYYERENEYTLAGSIYKGKVTRVLPGMQSSFVDVGLERDAFLYVTDFLEDSEDSDEYETSSAGGGARRGAERPAGEETAATGGEEPRRGRRDGRRNDGRRGERNVERSADRGTERTAEPVAEAVPQRPRASEERAAATAALRAAQPGEADREEKGDEETPEGTRRWRGRRGRRRGGMRAGVLGGAPQKSEGGSTSNPAEPFAMAEHGAPGGVIAPSDAAADTAESDFDEREPLELQASAESPAVQERQDGERGRGRRRDRGRDRTADPVRSDAGVTSSGVMSSPVETSAPVQKQTAGMLPGEALAKYGAVPSAIETKKETKFALPQKPVNYTPPRPATLVEVPAGWDGGFVLPGESLSRHKAAPAAAAAGLDQIAADSHSETPLEVAPQSPEIAAQATIESSEAAPTEAESVAPPEAMAEVAAPEIAAEALPGTEHAETLVTTAEPVAVGAPAADEQSERAIAETEAEQGAAPAEYEPEEGSSAARMAPPTRNELRLSRLFGGGGEHAAPAVVPAEAPRSVTPEQLYAPVAESEPSVAAGLHTSEPATEPATEAADVAAATSIEDHANHADHARTTLDAGNDALPELAASAEPAASEELVEPSEVEQIQRALPVNFADRFADEPHANDDPASHHELNSIETLGNAEATHSHQAAHVSDGFTELVDQLQGFAPGSGLLEEETIDEEEYDFDPIHAHADEHDLEDLEEETLDGHGHEEQAELDSDDEPQHVRMHEAVEDAADDEEIGGAFAFEEVGEEEEGESAAAGEPRRNGDRPGDDRGRRAGRNSRRRGAPGGGGRRQSAQTQDLPVISDLLKQGQEILVQIAKEPIAKKGARITSHIALPGRFLVFMPTVSHVGVSRKISSDEERQRLKRILISEKGESSGGFIVRTAADGASEEELRADLRFLISLWTEIKTRSETAKAPALIYHDLNLVERILRDQVSSNFSTIWVDTEQEYERIVRFLSRFQPSLVRRVKLYTKETPLFEHFGIQEEISKALKSKVWLKSGGSIVINQTEALVAIDINTGKYVGKTARLEDTIVKTNLDAIPEIVRQIRLRDLGGIIVIDFIDMDERKNRHKVLAALEEAMKVDRAPSKVLQFNDFGLVAITRKRVKQSLERTLSVTCETCAGTGMVKSPVTVCNEIFIELRKMQKHLDGKDVLLRVNPEVVKQLKSSNGRWINEYEEMVGKTIIIKSDPSLHPEQFDIH